MEFPHLGEHCTEPTCKQLDYLPLKCDACEKIFCFEHIKYTTHQCPSAYKKDVQVPVCPLCNRPVPGKRGEQPDIAVGAHIDRECQSDPAKDRRKIFKNKCTMKGCKVKEIIPVLCSDCQQNYCLRHRHPTDHRCEGKEANARKKALQAAVSRKNKTISNNPNRTNLRELQGQMSEDEALARALSLSLQETTGNNQAEEDRRMAQRLQESDRQGNNPSTDNRDRLCQRLSF